LALVSVAAAGGLEEDDRDGKRAPGVDPNGKPGDEREEEGEAAAPVAGGEVGEEVGVEVAAFGRRRASYPEGGVGLKGCSKR
jgi:hypothetical protein